MKRYKCWRTRGPLACFGRNEGLFKLKSPNNKFTSQGVPLRVFFKDLVSSDTDSGANTVSACSGTCWARSALIVAGIVRYALSSRGW